MFAQFPSTVRIDVGGIGYCSGTVIAPDIVVTAAHCADAARRFTVSSPGDIYANMSKGVDSNRSFVPIAYKKHERMCETLERKVRSSDFAKLSEEEQQVMIKEKNYNCMMSTSFDFAFLQLEKEQVFTVGGPSQLGCHSDLPVGTEFMIAGFGKNTRPSGSDANQNDSLFYGHNVVLASPNEEYLYFMKETPGYQMPNMGDSGGPLFAKDDSSVVYGVTSGGELNNRGRATEANYPKLSSPAAHAFYAEILKNTKIPSSLRKILTECNQ